MRKRLKDRTPKVTPPTDANGTSDAVITERNKFYDEYRRELTVKQNSNSESYDRNILTLSSGGLGLSLAFIKDIVHLEQTQDRSLLIFSWCCFAAAIVVTLCSFQFSQLAISKALSDAYEYYIKGDEKHQAKFNIWACLTSWLNWISGLLFVLAVITTALFVFKNLPANKNNEHPPIQAISIPINAAKQSTTSEAERRTAGQPTSPNNSTSEKIKP